MASGDQSTDLLAPPYPSRHPAPILERLDLGAHGIDVHVSNYRKDALDAAHVIRGLAAEIERLRLVERAAEGACIMQAPCQSSDVEQDREWWQMRARVAATLWAAFADSGMGVMEASHASGVKERDIWAMLRGNEGGDDTRDLFRVCFALGFRLRVDLMGIADAIEA